MLRWSRSLEQHSRIKSHGVTLFYSQDNGFGWQRGTISMLMDSMRMADHGHTLFIKIYVVYVMMQLSIQIELNLMIQPSIRISLNPLSQTNRNSDSQALRGFHFHFKILSTVIFGLNFHFKKLCAQLSSLNSLK